MGTRLGTRRRGWQSCFSNYVCDLTLRFNNVVADRLFPAFVLACRLIRSRFIVHNRRKTWRRIVGDGAFRFLASSLNMQQLQYFMGTTLQVYQKWAKQNDLPVLVEEVGCDAKLLWFGPKRTDRVVLYFHCI
jgi:hypothetical protein